MAFSYGFYNSLNGDRKYDAEDLSRIFDGIITDGVIGAVGNTFAVKVLSGNTVTVDSGRAWFNHTWTYNDAPMQITLSASEVLLPRWDAIVLEVDSAPDRRVNAIKAITGTAASDPAKPAMESSEYLHQYPLAYIYRAAGSTGPSQSDVENAVGSSACPICTAPLTSMQFDQIVAQWKSQFDDIIQDTLNTRDTLQAEYTEEFARWFNAMKGQLTEDAAGHLQTEVDSLQTEIDSTAQRYTATFTASGWTSTTTGGYAYTQTASLTPVKEGAPAITENSVFLAPFFLLATGTQATDETLQEALGMITSGYSVASAGTVTTRVAEKPSVDITVYVTATTM